MATPTDTPTNQTEPSESTVTEREGHKKVETEVGDRGSGGDVVRTKLEGESSSVGDGSVSDPDCTECGLVHPDPTPEQLIMYLHALRYTVSKKRTFLTTVQCFCWGKMASIIAHQQGPDWEYCTDMPMWAKSGDESGQKPPALSEAAKDTTAETSTTT